VLRFFNRNLPSRLFFALLLLLAIRVPLWWFQAAPLTLNELRQQVMGERLAGGATLYQSLFTVEAPLAAYLWALLAWLGGRGILLYRLVAVGLLLAQAVYFNGLLHRRGALAERGWLPAFLYGLVGGVWFELDALTPALWGQSFLLLAFGNLTATSREGYDNRNLFQAGLLLGVAGLCYAPLLLFMPVALVAIIFFAANAFRSSLLIIVGVLFPYAVLATAYFYAGTLGVFISQHLQAEQLWPFQPIALIPRTLTVKVLAIPLALLVIAVLRSLERGGQLNYQVRFRQVMLAWLGTAGLIVAAGSSFSPALLLFFLPPLAYFGPALVGRNRHAWVNEALFLASVVGMLAIRYAQPLHLTAWLPAPPVMLLAVVPPGQADPAQGVRGQRLLLIGNADLRAYLFNTHASPYFDWQLAEADFNALNTYSALYRLNQNFRRDRPTYLLDPQQRYVPTLRKRLPGAFGGYEPLRPGVWRLAERR
jgi:hypothetical protein